MRLRRPAFALALLASACAGFNVGSDEGCAAACASAHACGFLPSGLGYGPTSDAALADCERRCHKSPRDDDDITRLLGCLDGSWQGREEVTAWCLDPESALAGDLGCATASACLASEFKGSQLQGDVHIEVSLISFDDFGMSFGDDALAELYVAASKVVSSCDAALCGRQQCADDSEVDLPCDAALCGRQRVKTGSICTELGARVIELDVLGRRGPPVTQVLLDDSDGSACMESALTFTAEEYNVEPGPARASARASGRLPASELARIGISAVDDEEGSADYCVRFPGMTRTLRTGENVLLVPVGSIDDLVAAGLRPRGCDE